MTFEVEAEQGAGIELVVTDDAIRQVARAAQQRGTGARALRSILEKLLMDAMFVAPDPDVIRVVLDADAVTGKKPLTIVRNNKNDTNDDDDDDRDVPTSEDLKVAYS